MTTAQPARAGLLLGIGAYVSWGILPLYLKLLKGVPALQVLAHRILWSLILLAVIVLVARRGKVILAAARGRTLLLLCASAALIAINWMVYIWSVQNNHVLEASLGYFINPLINVALGVALLGERIRRGQAIAVGIAAIGVAILAISGGGAIWISLALALSFGFYGLVRKIAAIDALGGLTVETLLLAAPALAVLGFLAWLFGVAFRQQLNTLVTQLPILLDQLAGWASQSPVGEKIVDAVRVAYAGSRVAQDISGIVSGAGEFILNCLLLLVGALFFAADPKVYERGFLLLIPRSMRPALEDALFDTGSTLRLWLRAQLIQMTTMGVLVGIGLGIAGVPSAAALGLLTGLSEFVPYVGPIAAMLPALGLAAQGGNGAVIGTLITFAVVRLIQTNAITPFVTSRVVAIPPAVTLFAIIGIGTIFGLFGLFFSAALLVVAFTLIRSLYLRDVLGEDIPRSEHKTLLGPNASLKKDASSPD